MTRYLVILALAAVAGGFAYMANEIETLSASVGVLKAGNTALSNTERNLIKENSTLRKKARTLEVQNIQLLAQQNDAKRLMQEYRRRIVKRSLSRAMEKILKAGEEMIPIAGISVVAAVTTDDIEDLCTDIQEARELEQNLYGETFPISAEENRYCNESIGEEIANMAEEARKAIAEDLGISYQMLKQESEDLMESMGQIASSILNAPYQDEFNRLYEDTIKYWSELLEDDAGDTTPPAQSNNPPKLKETSEYWGDKVYRRLN